MVRTTVLWLLAVLPAGAGCMSAGGPRSAPPTESLPPLVASDRYFEFHSGTWLNLHHFLYTVARARSGRPAAMASLADTLGIGARSADEHGAWTSALDYYEHELAGRDALFDTLMVTIKNRLAEAEAISSLRESGLDPRLAVALDGAMPIYRAVWWPRHDAANRAWIASMLPLLARYGDTLAAGMTRAYGAVWPAPRLRVDVAPYVDWSGAYTTDAPPHVMISSADAGYKDARGLEMLFHEASHTFADSLVTALRDISAAMGRRAPFGVLHPIIFFTAGELTRRTVIGYTPFAEAAGFWRSGRMASYLPVIRRHWLAHLDGRSSLREAMRAIIAEL